MEKGKEYLGKIMGKEIDLPFSEKAVIIGRDDNLEISDEVQEFLQKQNLEEIIKINLGDDEEIPKVSGIIIYHEKKKNFTYINLSKKVQYVNNKFLHKFESTKLNNKSSIVIGKEIFFFIYAKAVLLNYYRNRLEKLIKRKEKNPENNLNTQNMKIIPNLKAEQTKYHSHVSLSSKGKRPIKKQKTEERKMSDNMNYTFDNILKPPSAENLLNNETENILDDIIESPTKSKLQLSNKIIK